MHRQAIKTLVPEPVYTDRQEFIDYYYHYALEAIHRRAMSSVLLGQRRMGKTEIFKRVVNRLFFDQDHTDPRAVVPVYFSFPDHFYDRWEFSLDYVENLLRWHAAFRWREPLLLSKAHISLEALIKRVKTASWMTQMLEGVLNVVQGLTSQTINIPEQVALILPREVSDRDDSTIVMFLDEFQNTRLPQYGFDIVGLMQEAVESPTCPHFITGSAMSILAKEILGRGALFGRFDSDPIESLTGYWSAELASRSASYYQTQLDKLMAPVVAHRCGGNPFYITAVVRQAAKKRKPIDSEETLNEMLAVDLSSGFIWAELNDQVTRWIERINEYGVTKWVLYLSALEEGEFIDPANIQKQLAEREGTHLEIAKIQNILVHLARGDLLGYVPLGSHFRKTDDPILLDFLKAWGKFEVEGLHHQKVITDTVKQYDALKRKINDQKGYLAEVYLAQILWNGQRKTFPGRCFHSQHDITFPNRFLDLRSRMRLEGAAANEIDVYASDGRVIWVCESKWRETRKVGADVVQYLLDLKEKLKDYEGRQYFETENPLTLCLWLFAHNGVTPEAETLLREHGIYWSDRGDLDELIRITGLRPLPDFKTKSN